MRWSGALGLAVAVVCVPLASKEATFRFTEQRGPHAVGLHVIEQYDQSRTYRRSTDALGKLYAGESARPLQTLVWYPAARTQSKPLKFSDYVDLWATETSFGRPQITPLEKEWRVALGATLDTPMWAVHETPAVSDPFPVAIYAPEASSVAWDNADLCEYLASHGYLVIAAPNMGATTRAMTIDLAGVETQARDIEFLIGYAHTLKDADVSRIAVVGQSWGGIANVFAAARDHRIDALVALDGSLRYFPGLVQAAGDVHPERMTIPMMYFAMRAWTIDDWMRYATQEQRDGPSVLNAWTHGDLFHVHMLGLNHSGFSSRFQRNEHWWWQLAHVTPEWLGDYSREEMASSYAWMARYTVRFLDAYLKRDDAALAYLKHPPGANGVPTHMMAVDFHPADGLPVSFDVFRSEVGRHGFDDLKAVFASLQERQAAFELDAGALMDWADDLRAEGHTREALQLLELNVQRHPDSSTAYTALGTVYLESGERQRARDCYRAALEKDPRNAEAVRRWSEVSASR